MLGCGFDSEKGMKVRWFSDFDTHGMLCRSNDFLAQLSSVGFAGNSRFFRSRRSVTPGCHSRSADRERGWQINSMVSGNAIEFDDRQMTTASDELDAQVKGRAGLALDEHLWVGARGGAWPGSAWFETRGAACGATTEIDFVWRGPFQGGMRAVAVVPEQEQLQLALERNEFRSTSLPGL